MSVQLLDHESMTLRPLLQRHGIRSAWSWPIPSTDDGVLGTLTAYWAAPGGPDEAQIALLHDSASVAAIAIERRLTIRRLTNDARRDSLTGLPNRRAILAGLEDALRRAGARGRSAVSRPRRSQVAQRLTRPRSRGLDPA